MTSRPGSDRPTNEQDGDSNAASPGNAGAPGNTGAVDRIVERFGGIRPMANKLDTPVTTVQGWKKRGAIPLARHADLRAAAAKHRIKIDEADLDAATPSEDRTVVVEGIIPASAPVDALTTDAVIVPPVAAAPDASPADTIPGDAVPVAITPVEGAPILGEPTATDTPKLDPAADAVTDPAAPKLDPEAPAVDGATSGTTLGGTIPLDATPATDTEAAARSAADKDDGPSPLLHRLPRDGRRRGAGLHQARERRAAPDRNHDGSAGLLLHRRAALGRRFRHVAVHRRPAGRRRRPGRAVVGTAPAGLARRLRRPGGGRDPRRSRAAHSGAAAHRAPRPSGAAPGPGRCRPRRGERHGSHRQRRHSGRRHLRAGGVAAPAGRAHRRAREAPRRPGRSPGPPSPIRASPS
ncbi:carph-isopro domain-containing protein [Azospirillum doebereinerae]|uniref:carph-isopro domain-containing protein n=1 Tax=Azospirillum doebereinerae TaxID=92933 RepID=UPI00384C66D8